MLATLMIAIDRATLSRRTALDLAKGFEQLAAKPDVPADIAAMYRAEARKLRERAA